MNTNNQSETGLGSVALLLITVFTHKHCSKIDGESPPAVIEPSSGGGSESLLDILWPMAARQGLNVVQVSNTLQEVSKEQRRGKIEALGPARLSIS